MDIWKYYGITHRDHEFCNPMSGEKFDEIVRLLRLPENARVLDIACGKTELLCRICEAYGASGVGVDSSSYEVEAARNKVAERGLANRVEIVHSSGADYDAPALSFDLTMCIGASWIWSGHEGTLKALVNWTKAGGLVLVGEPYKLQDPTPEHVEADEFVGTLVPHADNVRIGLELGLTFLYSIDSSKDDWDRYEFMQAQSAERWAIGNPDDPDVDALLTRSRAGTELYLRHGRDVIGWALYLFRKP
jgi:SAM-dependent methyltransferase